MLSEQETKEIKEKIIAQIEQTFPAEQIASARQQIEEMSEEELENFLERNKILRTDEEGEEKKSECVFCAIASGKIKSCQIEENKGAIAVLEINPISKGHALIVARSHEEKPQKEVASLAKKVSALIKRKFKAKKVELSPSRLFGHEVINILPVYSNETFDSERKHATIEELEEVKKELTKKIERKKKTKVEVIKEKLWLPRRIP
jgi:diadenosine tetraphosphate (Ap4A) HIT family hydrolase